MKFPGGAATGPYLLQHYSRAFLTIDCGEWTYGQPAIEVAPSDEKRILRIGRYCSIGPDVRIFVGAQGRHATDRMSTYPLRMAVSDHVIASTPRPEIELLKAHAPAKSLDTIIGHDVWIGAGATIFAGVNIGTGAVIGACALVTKDVPPYAIVGGVPADILRFRFSEEIVAEVLASQWWRLEPDEIWKRTGDGWALGTPGAVAKLLAESEAETPVRNAIGSLKTDLSNAADVLSMLETGVLAQMFAQPQGSSPLPTWPDPETQKRFTGGTGKSLVDRAAAFARVIEEDGAFSGSWRGLDYGCGWGRIASYLLTRGGPAQLDLCDAWQGSLNFIAAGGFKNRAFLVSELLKPGEINEEYDFIYAFSIFTHLGRATFENNLKQLASAIRVGGSVYFTVRHEGFLRDGQTLDEDGFWFEGKNATYGDSVVSRAYLERLAERFGRLRYLGSPESQQELYALTRV